MRKSVPILYSALMLTGVNLLLRLAGTAFQVYLSARIGAAGIGLLQLTMSVGNLSMVAAMAGIRTAAMYLTAEELGRGREENVAPVLSGCFLYSILCSGAVAVFIFLFSPAIAINWIGNEQILGALRLFAVFLPCSCLSGVMTGYFTAANRIGTLAGVEVAEQIFSMGVTLTALTFWAGTDAARACQSVILGGCLGSCFTLICLSILRLREHPAVDSRIPMTRRLYHTAVPLALADDVKSGINTVENLMVPKRLALNTTVASPLAAFGTVTGMVFPVLMFPACILFGLAELLIPELARCAAGGKQMRIRYLVHRSLKVAMLYGLLFGGLFYLLAIPLCRRLYGNDEAGIWLMVYGLLAPMLYCDAITDAMTKGLGQQKLCVRYNILTSALDVFFLFLLLPKYGMKGYFFSFLITHLLNFLLSLRALFRIIGRSVPLYTPVMACAASLAAIYMTTYLSLPLLRMLVYPVILGCLLYLSGILRREDLRWLRSLIQKK